ncbi:MAG: Addiction module toxin, RelE/StbE family [Berkelbacteria bacterium GW2011_GWA2_35_9]|uniref:Addiction module toxin, RelE/StbE family n=1 Tax=Berkelbacteria bacterium GW2011_GWA2_35_9 TaxID=1618333 RepID=A0A0G0G9R0_9BACT|nr:MAG: Addiction module toxin, RelE/StbE family [Berkelbacteria bacterium GW2011_GWA2_35_9]
MQIELHKSFVKDYDRSIAKIQNAFIARSNLFRENPYYPILKNHALVGKWLGHRSINITGNIRAIYKQIDENSVIFVALGSHSQLYK